LQDAQLAEHIRPVILHAIASEKRQHPGAGTSRVDADITEVLPKPDQRNLDSRTISMSSEMPYRQARHELLHQSPTGGSNGCSERCKEYVAGLVKDQIRAIQEQIVTPVHRKIKAARCE